MVSWALGTSQPTLPALCFCSACACLMVLCYAVGPLGRSMRGLPEPKGRQAAGRATAQRRPVVQRGGGLCVILCSGRIPAAAAGSLLCFAIAIAIPWPGRPCLTRTNRLLCRSRQVQKRPWWSCSAPLLRRPPAPNEGSDRLPGSIISSRRLIDRGRHGMASSLPHLD